MAKGIEIGIASETRAFKQGVETGMIKPLENAVDALDDLGKSKGPDQLEAGLKDAQKATDKLRKETKETADTIEREFRDSYRKAKQASKEGTDDMSENTAEFKNEAMSNFSEVASSFSGDISDMADGVQGLTGGLATALTPGVGIPIAILGAAAGAFLASWQENSEKTEERIGEMYDDMIESGLNYISKEQINAEIAATLRDPASYEEARKAAELLGMTTGEIAAAWASSGDAREQYVARAGAVNEEAAGTFDDLAEYASRKLLEKMSEIEAAQDKATERVDAYREAVDSSAKAAEEQANRNHTNLGTTATKVDEVAAKLKAMKAPDLKPGIDLSSLDRASGDLQRWASRQTLRVSVIGVDSQGRKII